MMLALRQASRRKSLRQRRQWRPLRRLAALIAVLAIAWVIGFGWFLAKVAAEQPSLIMPHADGIVVLTGGMDRVRAGLELLMAGAAPRLLISGAGAGTYLGDFTPRDGVDATARASRITIGHAALSTSGNGRETAIWVARHHIHSLIVVTADYHMPRALIELHRHSPGIALYAEPVRPPSLTHPEEWRTMRLLASEFTKYLLVRAELGGFAANHVEGWL